MFRLGKVYGGWTFERIVRHVLYWSFWMVFYPSVNAGYGEGTFGDWFVFESMILPFKLIYVYFTIYFLMPKFLYKRKYIRFFAIVILLAAIMGTVSRWIDVTYSYPGILHSTASQPFPSFKIVFKTMDMINVLALVAIIKFVQRQLQQENSNTQLKEEKLDAELKLLKNQLQPHFLFNTLNNLYGMILTNDKKASDIVLRLSDMVSYMLYECNDDQVPLEKEVKILDNYIELELIRYGKKLTMDFEKTGDFHSNKIAPLLLFPLLENAFKHGPGRLDEATKIEAYLKTNPDTIEFMVKNGKAREKVNGGVKSGIGLENVKSRLELMYPGKYEFEIKEDEANFEVLLKLQAA